MTKSYQVKTVENLYESTSPLATVFFPWLRPTEGEANLNDVTHSRGWGHYLCDIVLKKETD
jgi:hypothetical protein